MKRNGVGLANICIISTMLMVRLSSTLSRSLGCDEVVNVIATTDIVAQGWHYFSHSVDESTPEDREPINSAALNAYILDIYKGFGVAPTSGYQTEDLD